MIHLRMAKTVDGSLDGRQCRTYEAGEAYELPDQGPGGLADVFLREGWAELADAEQSSGEPGGEPGGETGNGETGGAEGESTPPTDDFDTLSFNDLKALAQQQPGFQFRAGISKADLIAFLRTGTLGTPRDGE